MTGRILFAVVIGLFLSGCDRAPEVQAPTPEVEEDISVSELPMATLAAPVIYDLSSILVDLEEAVPRSFGDLDERLDHPEHDRVQVSFEVERSPFVAEMRGETARITATLSYRGRAWYDPPLLPQVSASCGLDEDEEPPRALITLSSPLTLDPDWVLRSRAEVESVEAVSDDDRDRCRVTFLNVDVTGTALGAVKNALEGQTAQIDRRVAEVDVRSRLQGVWHTLQEPVKLTDDVWLMVNPQGVTRGATIGEGTVLTIQVGMSALPSIHLSSRPDEVLTQLPDLNAGEVADEARIYIEGRAHYPETSARLTRELREREVDLGGRMIQIREVALEGIGGGRVSLEVAFVGAARGRIFLVGTPELDLERGEVHVPDLDFDVATRNLLVGGLAWLAHDRLVEFLKERARLPVTQIMGPAREQLLRGLNRDLTDEVSVEGEVLSTRLLEVKALKEVMTLQAEAEARATFHIRQNGGGNR